jgi:thiol:disulfide interchange protein DsbD
MRSIMRNGCLALALIVSLVGWAGAQPSWDKALKSSGVAGTFDPATAKRGQVVTLRMEVELDPGYHTYSLIQTSPDLADSVPTFNFKDLPADLVAWKTPADDATRRETASDGANELFGKVVWEQRIVVRPDAAPGPRSVKGKVRFQVCDEQSCLPSREFPFEAKLTISDAAQVPLDPEVAKALQTDVAPPKAAPPGPPEPPKGPPEPARDPERPDAGAESSSAYQRSLEWVSGQLDKKEATPSSSLAFILAGIFWGAVSLVTPCVFPMIPITVSFFLKQSEKEHHRPVTMALVYCGTIVIVLTIAAVLLLSAFRYLSTNPYMNIGLGVLFVVFALSLFGMYDLELPSGLARFTSSREGKGGLVGTMFMALTFTIVSFACVAPFLGGFGGTSASAQISLTDRILGGFAFAATFASPFFVLALFPTLLKKLPRSGTWLNSVKVVMGFLELAAALVFFRTSELVLLPSPVLFTYDLVLGLWIAIMLLCGVYLLNVFRLPHDTPLEHLGVPRMLFGLLFVGLALYLLPALFKGGADGEKQRPSGVIYAWIDSFLLPDSGGRAGRELPWAGDLKKTIEEARAQYQKTRKPALVLIDFTGKTCKNCRYNEQNVFTKPEIAELMRKYQLVQLYTDTVPPELYPPELRDKIGNDGNRLRTDAAANLEFQKKAFATEQLPLYVILDPAPQGDEKKIEVKGIYAEGKINDPSAFAEFLKEPLGAAGQRAQAAR